MFFYSLSGLSRRGVLETARQYDDQVFLLMKSVLDTRQNRGGVNKGIRVGAKSRVLETYAQQRESLSYTYLKRHVHPDGVTTSPLDVTLKSCKI